MGWGGGGGGGGRRGLSSESIQFILHSSLFVSFHYVNIQVDYTNTLSVCFVCKTNFKVSYDDFQLAGTFCKNKTDCVTQIFVDQYLCGFTAGTQKPGRVQQGGRFSHAAYWWTLDASLDLKTSGGGKEEGGGGRLWWWWWWSRQQCYPAGSSQISHTSCFNTAVQFVSHMKPQRPSPGACTLKWYGGLRASVTLRLIAISVGVSHSWQVQPS